MTWQERITGQFPYFKIGKSYQSSASNCAFCGDIPAGTSCQMRCVENLRPSRGPL